MPSHIPNMHVTTKISITKEEKILQKRIEDAARKRNDRLSQKQKCPLEHDLFKEKERVRISKHDEMKRYMRRGMTEEELINNKKHVAEAKRKQRLRKKLLSLAGTTKKGEITNRISPHPLVVMVAQSRDPFR